MKRFNTALFALTMLALFAILLAIPAPVQACHTTFSVAFPTVVAAPSVFVQPTVFAAPTFSGISTIQQVAPVAATAIPTITTAVPQQIMSAVPQQFVTAAPVASVATFVQPTFTSAVPVTTFASTAFVTPTVVSTPLVTFATPFAFTRFATPFASARVFSPFAAVNVGVVAPFGVQRTVIRQRVVAPVVRPAVVRSRTVIRG